MNVKKIFVTLITIVALVIVGALVLNILLPNVTNSIVNATEDMVYNATGMDFDWNGDGNTGSVKGTGPNKTNTNDKSKDGAGVNGFN